MLATLILVHESQYSNVFTNKGSHLAFIDNNILTLYLFTFKLYLYMAKNIHTQVRHLINTIYLYSVIIVIIFKSIFSGMYLILFTLYFCL